MHPMLSLLYKGFEGWNLLVVRIVDNSSNFLACVILVVESLNKTVLQGRVCGPLKVNTINSYFGIDLRILIRDAGLGIILFSDGL